MSKKLPHFLLIAPFGLALFISAAAMFTLQLMVGKMMLPLTGGTPAGWIVALAFFQGALLAGYGLAWLLSRYSPRVQGRVYLCILILGTFFLPVAFPAHVDGKIGALMVLELLARTVALPFVALALTSSTLQRLFTSTDHVSAKDPYFLYATSNLGSMAGLLLYPTAIETTLGVALQSQFWFTAYAFLGVLGVCCLFLSGGKETQAQSEPVSPVSWRQRGEWIMLAFFPSSLLLGVTMDITTDIIAAPLIWIAPMALYLLTFVIAFSRLPFSAGSVSREINPSVTLIALAGACLASAALALPWAACWNLMAFTAIALMYHIRLARERPDRKHLSEYYFMTALGGALGGALNAFVAPVLFDRLIEYPAIAILACLLHPALRPLLQRRDIAFYSFFAAFAASMWYLLSVNLVDQTQVIIIGIIIVSAYMPRVALVAGMILLFMSTSYVPNIQAAFLPLKTTLRERDFFGIINVHDDDHGPNGLPIRLLLHGSTTHGFQVRVPGQDTTPTAYYAPTGPVGNIFTAYDPKNVAVVGLGTGSLACYATRDKQFTFFEIDPAMIKVAKSQFSFLEKCPGADKPRIVEGDGRIELEKLRDDRFDLIVLDAFSSDMIPAHLLTREAIALYLSRLNRGGVIAFHTTNRYLRLGGLMAATADRMGLDYRFKSEATKETFGSDWFVVASPGMKLDTLDVYKDWSKIDPPKGLRSWTDDYSSILSIIDR